MIITNRVLKFILQLSIFLIFGINSYSQNSNHFKGTLKIDSIWRPVIYMSHIESLNELYTISNDMIIAESQIDGNGHFSFDLSFLPIENKVYRIHVSKKNDPPVSLIIGGEEENHMFLILNKNENVEITNTVSEVLFRNIELKGSTINNSIDKINKIVSYKDSTDFGLSKVKSEFITNAINEKLRFVADTSKHSLVSLYALSKSDFKSNYPLNQKFYIDYLDKWDKEKSSYFRTFREQIPKDQKSNNTLFIVIGVISFILGFFLRSVSKVKRKNNKLSKRMKSLSVQERKIFSLIQLGKSNKEISVEYNIELSTVKSHISNIYSKLNIKSRKEALEIKF